jgi:hypothetical protein
MRKLVVLLLLMVVGCNNNAERIAQLEKQNHELQEQLKRSNATADFDLQAKCSQDSKAWFNENWAGTRNDKDTILLDFSNHYNKKLNKCFILVEYHYDSHFAGKGGSSWTNDMELWDIYENSRYGSFGENHYTYSKPEPSSHNDVSTCEVLGNKCTLHDEFNNLVRPYVND